MDIWVRVLKVPIYSQICRRRIWAQDRALDYRWNVGKNGLKYVKLSTDSSDDVSRENGPVRAPSERRNAPPGSPGRPQDRATAWEPFGGMLRNAWKHHVCKGFVKISKLMFFYGYSH